MYRTIRADKIISTAEQLVARVRERFPASGLAKVSEEILAVARETDDRCRLISRPNIPLRFGVVILIVLGAALAVMVVRNVRVNEAVWDASNFIQASESLLGDVVFLGAGIAFLVTLETRMKRGRALTAINELRALAHIIDMHQLTKDPEMVLAHHAPTAASPQRNMTPFELNRYLDYCSEMLALVSKIAALYVQSFPDSQALAAVDAIESLTTELSQKIWQKLMILDRYTASGAGMATITRRAATEEDLRNTPDDGIYELVDGEIRMSPAGGRHGKTSMALVILLGSHVKQHRLGHVVGPDTGHRLPSGNVRCPDVSFIRTGRFPNEVVPIDYVNLPPDLAVEVLSPRDRPRWILDKVGEYLEAGVRQVWIIDPQERRATVYRSLLDVRELGPEDDLDGEDVVPGFRCRLGEVFE